MLCPGISLRRCLGAYLRLKNDVFAGSPPYDPGPLEAFLREILGDTTTMSKCTTPRVMITSLMADRWPTELHLFRNYQGPAEDDDVKDGLQWSGEFVHWLVERAADSVSLALQMISLLGYLTLTLPAHSGYKRPSSAVLPLR